MAYRVTGKKRKFETKEVVLMMTSMIDMLTIVTFFLLKTFVEFNVIPSANLQLPLSISNKVPEYTINLVVSKDAIIVEGSSVVKISEKGIVDNSAIDKNNIYIIKPLYENLVQHSLLLKDLEKKGKEPVFRGRITLQADKNMPYHLLSKILYTAGQAGFDEFRFAVYHQPK